MKKIHITLVGSEITPVQDGINYIKPDQIIFICSEKSHEISENDFDIPFEIVKLDSNDLLSIHEKVLEIYSIYKDCNLSINLVGGTKSWSLVFFEVFYNTDTEFILVEQGGKVWDLRKKTFVSLTTSSFEDLFPNGMPTKFIKFNDYTEEDVQMVEAILKLKKINEGMFFGLIDEARRKKNEVIFERKENKLEWNKNEKAFYFTLEDKRKGKLVTKVLKSKNIRRLLIDAGWFEYKVASIISKISNVKEILTNCSFHANNDVPKNEIDIIAHIGNKLLFVECKTQIKAITDIDKFSSAAKNYGGLGRKALFVTNAPKKKEALEKCKDNEVLEFCLTDYKSEKDQILALKELLQKEIETNNAK